MSKTLLILDDDRKLVELLEEYFQKHGLAVVSAFRPAEGLRLLRQRRPDLVILDVMLPGQSGFDVCREIRRESEVPIIMLTARGEVTDRVVGLELGADDYLAKPFEPRELLARVQSVLRRGRGMAPSAAPLRFGTDDSILELNPSSHAATLGGKNLELTSTEFSALLLFARHPGQVLSRDQILDHLRGIDWEAFNRSVDVLISRLRQKLGDDPKHPSFFKTVRGTGYLFIATPRGGG
jgi:DNA-binding response OmpR family regulator